MKVEEIFVNQIENLLNGLSLEEITINEEESEVIINPDDKKLVANQIAELFIKDVLRDYINFVSVEHNVIKIVETLDAAKWDENDETYENYLKKFNLLIKLFYDWKSNPSVFEKTKTSSAGTVSE